MECEDAELSVLFTGDQQIRELNHQYRGKDSATDVLSFPQNDSDGPEELGFQLLGDVVISLETAERQAAELGVTLQQEVVRLLIHGVLHLLGYDHENVPQAEVRRMEQQEERLWNLLEGESYI